MKNKRILRITACFLSVLLITGVAFGWSGAGKAFAEEDLAGQGMITDDFEESYAGPDDIINSEDPFGETKDGDSAPEGEPQTSDFEGESLQGNSPAEAGEGEPSLGAGVSDEPQDGTQDGVVTTETPIPEEKEPETISEMQEIPTAGSQETDGEEGLSTAADTTDGTYSGSWEERSGGETVMFEATLVLNEGKFAYYIRTIADCMDYDDTEKIVGTYSETSGRIIFNDSDSRLKSGVLEKDVLTINGILTSFSVSPKDLKMEKETDAVETITSPKRTNYLQGVDTDARDKNGLRSGKYSLTEQSYDSSAVLKPKADIVIDVEKLTFVVLDLHGVEKAKGLIEYNSELGCYEILYNDEEDDLDDEEYDDEDDEDYDEEDDEDYDEEDGEDYDEEDGEDYDDEDDETISGISGSMNTISSDFEMIGSVYEGGSDFVVSGAVSEDEDDEDDGDDEEEEDETEGFVLAGTGIRFMEALRFGDGYINTLNDDGDFLPYTASYALDQSFDYSDEFQFGEETTETGGSSTPSSVTYLTATPQPTAVARTTTTANTGDPNSIGLYCLLAGLAAAGIVFAVRKKKA